MRSEYKKGGTGMLVKIAYRNIWRNKRRTIFCLSAVGIVVLFMVVYTAFDDGEARNVYDTVQVYEVGHVRVVSAQYEAENEYMPVWYPVSHGANWRDAAAAIQAIPGIRAVFPRIVTMATLLSACVAFIPTRRAVKMPITDSLRFE
jgi:ABC-type lipoprotein release transport system permease subunit